LLQGAGDKGAGALRLTCLVLMAEILKDDFFISSTTFQSPVLL
jgi:hypothetical protein